MLRHRGYIRYSIGAPEAWVQQHYDGEDLEPTQSHHQRQQKLRAGRHPLVVRSRPDEAQAWADVKQTRNTRGGCGLEVAGIAAGPLLEQHHCDGSDDEQHDEPQNVGDCGELQFVVDHRVA